jgi:hypothetical protein
MNQPLPQVHSFGYHTLQFWSFSKEACERSRSRIVRDWPFPHSPAEAISPVREISFSEVQPDWLHADQPHRLQP